MSDTTTADLQTREEIAAALQATDLRRLEALENLPSTKLSLPLLEELGTLKERYGSTYERKLAQAQERFKRTLLQDNRFADLRMQSASHIMRSQLDTLDEYALPEKVALITPQQSLEMRAVLSNRLVTVSALRRHSARIAGTLRSLVTLAEETWMGLSPADREWRMKGEMAELLDSPRALVKDYEMLAQEADNVYWSLRSRLETVEHMSKDWDRCNNRAAAEREAAMTTRKTEDNGI